MTLAYIGVGSNLGDRNSNLEKAKKYLESEKGISFLESSEIYETDPVGGPAQEKYLNAVWWIETSLAPRPLLELLLGIEKKMGRVRSERNAPRMIDLDILFYGEAIIHEAGLDIPHPRLHERSFVLKPLSDLAPDWMHPVLKKTVQELLGKIHANH